MANNNEVTITSEEARALRNECNRKIELANALSRLFINEDFKRVFLEEYQKEEAARLVSLFGEASFNMSGKKEEHREEFMERIIGISRFSEFTRNVFRMAEQAHKTLEDLSNAEILQ